MTVYNLTVSLTVETDLDPDDIGDSIDIHADRPHENNLGVIGWSVETVDEVD